MRFTNQGKTLPSHGIYMTYIGRKPSAVMAFRDMDHYSLTYRFIVDVGNPHHEASFFSFR